MLFFDIELFVLVVIGGVIYWENVDLIKVKIIIEGVNGFIDLDVDDMFVVCDILVFLDIFVNVGGVIVSYFEWV